MDRGNSGFGQSGSSDGQRTTSPLFDDDADKDSVFNRSDASQEDHQRSFSPNQSPIAYAPTHCATQQPQQQAMERQVVLQPLAQQQIRQEEQQQIHQGYQGTLDGSPLILTGTERQSKRNSDSSKASSTAPHIEFFEQSGSGKSLNPPSESTEPDASTTGKSKPAPEGGLPAVLPQRIDPSQSFAELDGLTTDVGSPRVDGVAHTDGSPLVAKKKKKTKKAAGKTIGTLPKTDDGRSVNGAQQQQAEAEVLMVESPDSPWHGNTPKGKKGGRHRDKADSDGSVAPPSLAILDVSGEKKRTKARRSPPPQPSALKVTSPSPGTGHLSPGALLSPTAKHHVPASKTPIDPSEYILGDVEGTGPDSEKEAAKPKTTNVGPRSPQTLSLGVPPTAPKLPLGAGGPRRKESDSIEESFRSGRLSASNSISASNGGLADTSMGDMGGMLEERARSNNSLRGEGTPLGSPVGGSGRSSAAGGPTARPTTGSPRGSMAGGSRGPTPLDEIKEIQRTVSQLKSFMERKVKEDQRSAKLPPNRGGGMTLSNSNSFGPMHPEVQISSPLPPKTRRSLTERQSAASRWQTVRAKLLPQRAPLRAARNVAAASPHSAGENAAMRNRKSSVMQDFVDDGWGPTSAQGSGRSSTRQTPSSVLGATPVDPTATDNIIPYNRYPPVIPPGQLRSPLEGDILAVLSEGDDGDSLTELPRESDAESDAMSANATMSASLRKDKQRRRQRLKEDQDESNKRTWWRSYSTDSLQVSVLDSMYLIVAFATSCLVMYLIHPNAKKNTNNLWWDAKQTPNTLTLVFFVSVQIFSILWVISRFFVRSRKGEWEIVDDLAEIRRDYLHGWFAADCIYLVPFELIFIGWRNDIYYYCLCRHFIRCFRVVTLGRNDNPLVESRQWFRLLSFMGVLFLFLSAEAGIFWKLEDGFQTLTYTDAAYWAVVTMTSVGYGDVVSRSGPWGQVFTALACIIGVLLIASLTAFATSYLTSKDILSEELDKKKKMMYSMLAYYEIPWEVQREVISLFPTVLAAQSEVQFKGMIEALPPFVAEKIERYLRAKMLRGVPLFKDLQDESVMTRLTSLLEQRFAPPYEFVILAGDIGAEMFFLVRGVVEVLVGDVESGEEKVVATLRTGAYFGEIALMQKDNTRTASIQTVVGCELFVLTKAHFQSILMHSPELQKRIQEEVQKRKEANEKSNVQQSPGPGSPGSVHSPGFPNFVEPEIIPASVQASEVDSHEDRSDDPNAPIATRVVASDPGPQAPSPTLVVSDSTTSIPKYDLAEIGGGYYPAQSPTNSPPTSRRGTLAKSPPTSRRGTVAKSPPTSSVVTVKKANPTASSANEGNTFNIDAAVSGESDDEEMALVPQNPFARRGMTEQQKMEANI